MSAAAYIAGDKFVVRIFKSLATNPDNKWANSYEFTATTPGTESGLLLLLTRMVTFERALHFSVVNFVQAMVSTWEEDSKPYNPESFVSSPLSSAGIKTVESQLLSLSQTYSVTRVAATGRFGHIFFRGALQEQDVEAPAGKSILSNKVSMQTLLDTSIDDSSITDYMGSPASGDFQLVMISKDGSQVRNVVGLVAQGVSQVPADHAWFNRTTTPTP